MTDTTTETKERPAAELVALAAWVNVPSPAHLPKDMRAQSDPHTMAAWRRVAEALIEHGTIDPDAIVRAALERVAQQIETHCYTSNGGEHTLEFVSSERLRGIDMHHATIAAFIRALANDPAERAAIIKKAEEENNG